MRNRTRHTARSVTCPTQHALILGYPPPTWDWDWSTPTWYWGTRAPPPEGTWDQWLEVLWDGDGVPENITLRHPSDAGGKNNTRTQSCSLDITNDNTGTDV